MKRIYLSSPHMGGQELDFVHDAFEKNWIAPLGENVNKFEEDLQQYTGRESAAVVTSGTAAIHLALILCGVKPGDEVICQSFTFAASANPIRYQGASPVFVDSEPQTWNMDPDLLEEAIVGRMQETGNRKQDAGGRKQEAGGRKPKAIVVVHLYGMPAKMERILEIGEKYGIPVIEDAAEALGSSLNGRMCGNFGDYSILSFNGNKIITTSGGGALLADNPDRIEKARFLATQARDQAPHYEHSVLGYNYRMSNIVAGIGRGQMKVLNDRVTARRANHDYYFNKLEGAWLEPESISGPRFLTPDRPDGPSSGFYFLPEPEGYHSNRWLTTAIVNPEETGGVTRDDIRIALEKENIECRPLWKPMHLQPLYVDAPFYGSGVSEWLFRYGLCLPSGSNLKNEDLERVVHAVCSIIK